MMRKPDFHVANTFPQSVFHSTRGDSKSKIVHLDHTTWQYRESSGLWMHCPIDSKLSHRDFQTASNCIAAPRFEHSPDQIEAATKTIKKCLNKRKHQTEEVIEQIIHRKTSHRRTSSCLLSALINIILSFHSTMWSPTKLLTTLPGPPNMDIEINGHLESAVTNLQQQIIVLCVISNMTPWAIRTSPGSAYMCLP